VKQRKVYTKIWKDDWFYDLSQNARLIFLYLLTNESIGFSGCYEISDRQILFDTKVKELDKVKKELFPKVVFSNGWVYVVNAQGYNNFVGESFEKAISKEMALIPDSIKNTLINVKEYPTPEVTVGYSGGTNSTCNSNNNSKYNKIEDLKEEDFEDIASKYQVPVSFVRSKLDDLINWHEKNPQKNYYRNYLSGLRDWVKRDSLKIKQDYGKDTSDIAL
jgi:hypothetical protein